MVLLLSVGLRLVRSIDFRIFISRRLSGVPADISDAALRPFLISFSDGAFFISFSYSFVIYLQALVSSPLHGSKKDVVNIMLFVLIKI